MIKDNEATDEVRSALQRFQDGYTTRDVSRLDEFMTLFVSANGGNSFWDAQVAGKTLGRGTLLGVCFYSSAGEE